MNCYECGYPLPANGGACRVCKAASKWEEKYRKERVQELGLPKRTVKNLLALDITPDEKDVQTILNGDSLFLYGNTGSGKTLYAAAIMLEVTKRGIIYPDIPRVQIAFITSLDLLEKIRASFNTPKSPQDEEDQEEELKTTKEIMDYYSSVDLLVLDDFGSEKPTEWALSILQIIINARYGEMLPTIITSNFDLNVLSNQLDDRIASRLYEMCESVPFGNKDHRLNRR